MSPSFITSRLMCRGYPTHCYKHCLLKCISMTKTMNKANIWQKIRQKSKIHGNCDLVRPLIPNSYSYVGVLGSDMMPTISHCSFARLQFFCLDRQFKHTCAGLRAGLATSARPQPAVCRRIPSSSAPDPTVSTIQESQRPISHFTQLHHNMSTRHAYQDSVTTEHFCTHQGPEVAIPWVYLDIIY